MSAAAPGMTATCAGFPDDWLTTIGETPEGQTTIGTNPPNFDSEGVSQKTFVSAAAARVLDTRSTFELSSLNINGVWGEIPASIRALHDNITASLGPLPENEKPILRFLYGAPGLTLFSSVDEVYEKLTAELADIPIGEWNVRIAVKQTAGLPGPGHNHTKLIIVDGHDATTTSYETGRYELALRLTGPAAHLAQDWFNQIWMRDDTWGCRSSVAWGCGDPSMYSDQGLPLLDMPLASPQPELLPVNVISLPRGALAQSPVVPTGQPTMVTTADDALFAGIGATQQRVFLLQPGLNPLNWATLGQAEGVVSTTLIEKTTEAAARGVDAKIVWGFLRENPIEPAWKTIQSIAGSKLKSLETAGTITAEQRDIARCMIRAVPYNGDNNDSAGMSPAASHAKFYMLDEGFYVGSQNLYPSELALGEVNIASVLPNLDDHGFFVDVPADANHERTADVTRRIVQPIWNFSKAHGTILDIGSSESFPTIDCAALPHSMKIKATVQMNGVTYDCGSNVAATLDFHVDEYNEIAKLSGTGVCESPIATDSVNVSFEGIVMIGGQLVDGELKGTLPQDGVQETLDLTGTWQRGYLSLAFSGAHLGGTLVSGSGASDGSGDGNDDDGSGDDDGDGDDDDDGTSGSSWGDPHLVTLDGLAYDFQAVGEFVAVESMDSSLIIQVRQQPWGESTVIAVNTALALMLGSDRVGLYAGRPEDPLYVNGSVSTLASGSSLSLSGGGTASRSGGNYVFEWPGDTGERVEASLVSGRLDLRITLPASRYSTIHGLFGNFDGDPINELLSRQGELVSSPTASDFFSLYANSWRVTASETLFDYDDGNGEHWDGFTNLGFPSQFVSSQGLSEEESATARAICIAMGVADPVLLDACILDVALTGDESYAAGAASAEPPTTTYVNLAANRPVAVEGPSGSGGPETVTDTVFAPEGTQWDDPQYAITIPAGTSVTIDLGQVYSVAQVIAQVDDNDSYDVYTSVNGTDWTFMATVPAVGGSGLRTRPAYDLNPPVIMRYARGQAVSGDGSYSVSEIQLFGPTTPVAQ